MKRNTKLFVLSMCITCIAAMLIGGLCLITYKGNSIDATQSASIRIDTRELSAAGRTADNALSIFYPEIKTAAQIIMLLCAVLSKII